MSSTFSDRFPAVFCGPEFRLTGFSYVVTILPQFRHCLRLRMMLPSVRWRV